MSALFVTATGTDIGKTWIAAGLIRHLRATGVAACALKPVVSGFDPQSVARSDPAVLLDAMGAPATSENIAAIAPFRFAAAIAPDMAARREGRRLRLEAIAEFCQTRMAETSAPLLIEGVGGVMSPIADDATCLDLMRALQLPAMLVAGSYLGAISHTLTAVAALAQAGLPPRAVIVNETADSDVSLGETCAELARFLAATPIIAVRRDAGPHDECFVRMAAASGLMA